MNEKCKMVEQASPKKSPCKKGKFNLFLNENQSKEVPQESKSSNLPMSQIKSDELGQEILDIIETLEIVES